jgi:hypothetical protein
MLFVSRSEFFIVSRSEFFIVSRSEFFIVSHRAHSVRRGVLLIAVRQ